LAKDASAADDSEQGQRRRPDLHRRAEKGQARATDEQTRLELRNEANCRGWPATEALFRDERVRQFEGIARVAKRKLESVNAASQLGDLTIPPSNRLEKLKGDLKDFHSIRINYQWRVIFKWINGEPHEVRIIDYH
jgi:proteic killer suppression protein